MPYTIKETAWSYPLNGGDTGVERWVVIFGLRQKLGTLRGWTMDRGQKCQTFYKLYAIRQSHSMFLHGYDAVELHHRTSKLVPLKVGHHRAFLSFFFIFQHPPTAPGRSNANQPTSSCFGKPAGPGPASELPFPLKCPREYRVERWVCFSVSAKNWLS